MSEAKTTRIRYNATNDLLVSRGDLITKEFKSLLVTINTKNNTFIISDVVNNSPLREGGAETLALTKKAAKNALIMLGVDFTAETRNTSTDEDNADVDGDETVGFHSAR